MSLKRLQKIRARMLIGAGAAKGNTDSVFYATFLMSTPQVVTTAVPLMATDAKSIFINLDGCAAESDEVITTLLVHEVEHIAFNHLPRMAGLNRDVWNQATDYIINQRLAKRSFVGWEGWLHNPQRFTGMFEEQVYQLLIKERDSKQSGQGQRGQTGQPSQSDPRMGNDLQEPEGHGDPAAAAELQRSVQQRVASAAQAARMAGKLSGDLERLVSSVLEPVVPWRELLREYMTRVTTDDESWSKRNRRFALYLPSRYSTTMGEMIFIGDTSGSITSDELDQGAAEVGYIADHIRPSLLRIIGADTSVKSEQTFEVGEPVTCAFAGGGGTDMRVPLEYVAQYDPQVVVLMTDGYTPWPDAEPPYPLIVLCTTNQPVPIGHVIRL